MKADRQEFKGTRARIRHGLLLSVVLAAIALLSLFLAGPSVPDAELVGTVLLVLSAGVLVVVFRSARDRRPRMVLDPSGIWFRDWDTEIVPWSAVRDAYAGGSRIRTFITVRLAEPEDFLDRLPEPERRKLRSNRLFRLPELRIPHTALDAPHDEVLAAIKSRISAARRSRAPADTSHA